MSEGQLRASRPTPQLPAGVLIDRDPDIGQVERWVSMLLGGALIGYGVRRGGLLGAGVGIVGAGLVARGVARRDPLTHSLRSTTAERVVARRRGWTSAAIVSRAVTINRPRAELYRYWRDFSNLPRFVDSVRRIDVIDGQRSRWVVDAPAGFTVEWEAVVTTDEPDRRIGWESEDGGDVRNAGWVDFRDAPGGRGTEVRAEISYEPPAGQVGRVMAFVMSHQATRQMRSDLRRFKALMETGEKPTASSRAEPR